MTEKTEDMEDVEETGLKVSRLFLGLAGALAVAALILSLGGLIILGNRTESFLKLQQFLEQLGGG